jgi:hypothetical protein
MDRVTQSLWRGVEGPRRCLMTPAARSFSTTGPGTVFPLGPRTECVKQGLKPNSVFILCGPAKAVP